MNQRQRFLKTLRFQPVDHPPLRVDGPWPDTLQRWYREGLPRDVALHEYFGTEPMPLAYAGPDTGPFPPFTEKIIEEKDNEIIKIDRYGRTVRDFKDHTSMPEWLEFPVKCPEDLRRIMTERFDPDTIDERFPPDWERKLQELNRPDREEIVFLDGGCYYGRLRNLAGVHVASLLFYDAPELVDEFFERQNVICLEGMKRALPRINADYLGFGEDIAYKTSTLISPAAFRRFLLPRYKKTVDLATSHGIDITWYDSDGNLNPFLPLYFEAGINGFHPCEVAADMDPVHLRARYGPDIRLLGGIDKRALAAGPEAIRKEVESKVPRITDQGGYIPYVDHSVSSDISLDNYRYYLDVMRQRLRM